MKKILKNKTAIGIGAIILGLLISFILTPIYNSSLEEKVQIVRVKKEVEEGEAITEDMLEEVEVGSYNMSKQLILKKEDAIGKYSKEKLYAGESILQEKLSGTPLASDYYLENLDGTKNAISITIQSFAAGLSSKLISGDIVSIIATDDSDTIIPVELKYVKLLASTTENGNDLKEKKETKDSEEAETTATVTLLVNEEQAKVLANYEQTKKMHIALVYRGTEEKANDFLLLQEKTLEESLIEDSADNDVLLKEEVVLEQNEKTNDQEEGESNKSNKIKLNRNEEGGKVQ